MGWQLEAGKMLAYLAFPVAAFAWFNHPSVYENSLRQAMPKDLNLDQLDQLERLISQKEVEKLTKTVEQLNDS